MAQIVRNEPNFGQNLATGLSRFADRKLQQMDARHAQAAKIKALTGTGKLTAQEAEFIASLPEKNQWEAAQTIAQQRASEEEGSRNFTPQQFVEAGIPQEDHAGFMEFLQKQQQPSYGKMSGMEMLNQSLAQGQRPPIGVGEVLQQLQAKNAPLQQQEQAALQEISLGRQEQKKGLEEESLGKQAMQQAEQSEIAKAAPSKKAPLGLTKQQQIEDRQLKVLAHKERIQAEKDKADRFKATKEFRHLATESASVANDELSALERFEKLEPKLDTAGYNEFLKRSGLDIATLKNPESQEFEKLAQSFTKQAKTYFGGRVSNFEVEQFLKTIPNLSQSPEGRKRVIANMKRLALAKKHHFESMRKIMKENKGIVPYDIEEQVYEDSLKYNGILAQQFKKDLERPVPEAQNKLITAAQAIAGEAIGSAGNIAKTIAKVGGGAASGAWLGAKYGRFFGPHGAAIGAGLGGLAGLFGL